MSRLKGQIALVTGASRGIGRAIALRFAQEGAYVVVNYAKDEGKAKETLDMIHAQNGEGEIYGFDVSNAQEVDNAVNNIVNNKQKIDILVNNAGVSIDGLIIRLKEEDFIKQIDINLKGAFLLMKACSRPMIKARYGRIINISSIVGQTGNAGQTIYSAAKAGLIGMTKSLARELALRNILVNAIAPGFILTDMTSGILERNEKEILPEIPLGRIGSPKDVADAALFLASSEAGYITGQVLAVNGGMYM